MAWDYAELSKAAKKVGGPEKLLDLIVEEGKSIGRIEGRSSMKSWLMLTAIGGTALGVGVTKLIDYFKTKKADSQAAIDEAKAELIRGIEEYDTTHPDESKENVWQKERNAMSERFPDTER